MTQNDIMVKDVNNLLEDKIASYVDTPLHVVIGDKDYYHISYRKYCREEEDDEYFLMDLLKSATVMSISRMSSKYPMYKFIYNYKNTRFFKASFITIEKR